MEKYGWLGNDEIFLIIIIIIFFRYLDVKTFYHLVLYYIHININFIK